MNKNEVTEIIQCLPKDKTHFHYFKDRYALLLLSYFVGEGQKRSQIKNSQFSKLLNKKIVQKAIAKEGRAIITKDTLNFLF